jgi:hypothetical protein
VDEATREARDARAVAQRLGEELASCRAQLDAAVAVAARAEASAAFGDVFGSSDASATRVARLDAAFAAACSTLEALGETAAMAAMGGWIAVAETLEAPVPGVAALEGLADESGKDARLSPDTFGRAGSKPETRMCRAVRDVVAAVRDAAAVAAAAEERQRMSIVSSLQSTVRLEHRQRLHLLMSHMIAHQPFFSSTFFALGAGDLPDDPGEGARGVALRL